MEIEKATISSKNVANTICRSMKSIPVWVLLFLTTLTCFSSCSDDDEKFDYPMESIYGKWEGTDIYANGKWVDVTGILSYKFGFSINFHEDGSYEGYGYFGNGSGTYTAKGKTIETFVNGKLYATYYIKSLTGNTAELTIDIDGEQIDLKVRKK